MEPQEVYNWFSRAVDFINATESYKLTVSSYSGRGMYGRTVFAISGDINGMRLGAHLIALKPDELDLATAQQNLPTHEDSLGYGTVFYSKYGVEVPKDFQFPDIGDEEDEHDAEEQYY